MALVGGDLPECGCAHVLTEEVEIATPDPGCVLPSEKQLPGGEIRILWYNVENLFHPSDDSLSGDDEFTPAGVRHWTWKRYRRKITALAKVIIASGEWDPPELVGLGEIENDSVLEDLVTHPILRPYGYSYLHRDSPDWRGIDVALLYRKERFRVLEWSVHGSPPGDLLSSTRDMMHISGVWGKTGVRGGSGTRTGREASERNGVRGGSGDTLDLFLVHLISRYSGTGATASYRRKQACLLVRLVDSVRIHRLHPLVVLGGDFNEQMEGYSLQPLRKVRWNGDSVRSLCLDGSAGSYKYRGKWERIDQFMVAGGTGKYRFAGSIVDLPVLLIPDEAYGGLKPWRTYVGFDYREGVSDHLPILLVIRRRLVSVHSGQ